MSAESIEETQLLSGPTPGRAASWRAEIATIEVVYGFGSLDKLSSIAAEFGSKRPLIVSDPGVAATGAVARAAEALRADGCEVAIYADSGENPTSREVEIGVAFAAEHQTDLLVALGGGSAMDCAKGINFLLTNAGKMSDYRGMNRAPKPLLPSIGIPTTAGTGSDAQSYALITDAETGQKMACGDRQARFRTVILDPQLLSTTPAKIVSASGLDALAHAVESLVSTRSNPLSRLFSVAAWKHLEECFEDHLADRQAVVPAGKMLFGAHLAGAAIEQSMLGAAHASANPLTRHHGIRHGEAVALMLPATIRYNADSEPGQMHYRELTPATAENPAETLAVRFEQLAKAAGVTTRLSERGLVESDLHSLALDASKEWTGTFNPRPLDLNAFTDLYRNAL